MVVARYIVGAAAVIAGRAVGLFGGADITTAPSVVRATTNSDPSTSHVHFAISMAQVAALQAISLMYVTLATQPLANATTVAPTKGSLVIGSGGAGLSPL
jgi:hypothetical protein